MFKCMKKCTKTCPVGHMCKKKCYQECGDCVELVLKTISICQHEDNVRCSVSVDEAICKQICLGLLSCGHKCPGQCGQCRIRQRHHDCKELVPFTWPCGHKSVIECSQKNSSKSCPCKCGATLDCGHTCKGTCSDCLEGLVHLACEEKCGKRLPCGHKCQGYCDDQCLPCTMRCPDRCSHGICSKGNSAHVCGEVCDLCAQPCKFSCTHNKCFKICSKLCGSLPCSKKCKKKVHKCSDKKNCKSKLHSCTHTCSGLCGEKCVCAVCETVSSTTATDGNVKADAIESQQNELKQDGEEKVKTNNGNDMKQSDTLLIKLYCGHIFKVDELDKYIETFDPDGCRYLHCPLCKQLITESMRYECVIKERRAKRETSKEALRKETSVTKEEKEKLILSEKQFDDSTFFNGFRVMEIIEGPMNRLELEALSFQFKCAYALNIINSAGPSDNKQWDKALQSIKKSLLKVNKRVTVQQKKEFTRELLKLLTEARIWQLNNMNDIADQLNEFTKALDVANVDRERFPIRGDDARYTSYYVTNLRNYYHDDYRTAIHRLDKAKEVLLANDNHVICC